MATPSQTTYTSPEEYLALEREAEYRSEYFNGEMFAMSGTSRAHSFIAGNVLTSLNNQFMERPCEAHVTDLRVKVSATGAYTYPDVVALCGEAELEDDHFDTLLNPNLIVEVLSPSTEAYDRGGKFEQYRTIESLTDFLLIAQDRVHVEHYVRQTDEEWLLRAYNQPENKIHIASLGCDLALRGVYRRVEFKTEATGDGAPSR